MTSLRLKLCKHAGKTEGRKAEDAEELLGISNQVIKDLQRVCKNDWEFCCSKGDEEAKENAGLPPIEEEVKKEQTPIEESTSKNSEETHSPAVIAR